MQSTMKQLPMRQHVAMARATASFVPIPARTILDFYAAVVTTRPDRAVRYKWIAREHMFSTTHEEVADTARFYELDVTCESLGGRFIRRYHYTATGSARSMSKFLEWLVGNGAAGAHGGGRWQR